MSKSDTDQPAAGPMLLGVYVLLAGLVVGLMLGPWCMGRWDRQRYDAWFPNPVMAQVQLDLIAKSRNALAMTDVTPVALKEFDQRNEVQTDTAKAQLAASRDRQGLMNALLLAAVVCLLVSNVMPRMGRLHARMHLASHLLLASWLAMLIAQPYLLAKLPGLVLLGGLVLAGLLCLIPGWQPKVQAATADAETEHEH